MTSTRAGCSRAAVVAVGVMAAVVMFAGCTTEAPVERTQFEYSLSPALQRRSRGPIEFAIVQPTAGESVPSPFKVKVDVANFVLTPSGRSLDGEGHLHVIVDQPCIASGETIPNDAQHLHVGNGRPEVLVDLEPGTHRLCVQLSDGFHSALAISEKVVVEVR